MTELWTNRYFDTVYHRRWRLGPPDETIFRQVDFIIGQLGACEGDSLIDVGCGQGRYSLAFAARGLQVTGLDASEVLLSQARELDSDATAGLRWILGDMRRLPETESYQYAVLFDAFGFFESDDENEDVIRQIRQVVRPGGGAVIAVVNGAKILNDLEGVSRQQSNGHVVEVRRALTGRILREDVVVTDGKREYRAERRQRLYSVSEIEDLVVQNGLRSRCLYGDLLGELFSEESSWKIVMICERIGDA
jgi:SAM-dependent methyltransferase